MCGGEPAGLRGVYLEVQVIVHVAAVDTHRRKCCLREYVVRALDEPQFSTCLAQVVGLWYFKVVANHEIGEAVLVDVRYQHAQRFTGNSGKALDSVAAVLFPEYGVARALAGYSAPGSGGPVA
jgi:hypothetical protein